MNNKLVIAAIGIVAVLGLVFSLSQHQPLGASSGNQHYNTEYFYNTDTGTSKGAINTPVGTYTNILGVLLAGDIIQGVNGWSQTLTATTTITAANFCSGTSILIANTTGTITVTLPAATTTWVACGSPTFGGWSTQLIANESTNTVVVAGGTGTYVRVASGTSLSIAASSTLLASGYWVNSSTLIIADGVTSH